MTEPINLLSEWHHMLKAVPPPYVRLAYAHLVGWLLSELDRASPELHGRVREGMLDTAAMTVQAYERQRHDSISAMDDRVVVETIPPPPHPTRIPERYVVSRHLAEQLIKIDPEGSLILEDADISKYERGA